MTSLIAIASSGKGTWQHVQEVINQEEWDNIYLITNEFGIKNFQSDKKVNFVVIDPNKFTNKITDDIVNQLKGKITDLEVAINFISGSGKEHMALMAALMKLGLSFRLVVLTLNGIKELL